MTEETQHKVINYFWVTLTVLIAFGTLLVSISTISDMVRTRYQIWKLDQKIERLEAKIEADSIFIKEISSSPEFMERFAREQYHMQRAGETVYILEK